MSGRQQEKSKYPMFPIIVVVLIMVLPVFIKMLKSDEGNSWRQKDERAIQKMLDGESVPTSDIVWLFQPYAQDRLRALKLEKNYAEIMHILQTETEISMMKKSVPVPAVQLQE